MHAHASAHAQSSWQAHKLTHRTSRGQPTFILCDAVYMSMAFYCSTLTFCQPLATNSGNRTVRRIRSTAVGNDHLCETERASQRLFSSKGDSQKYHSGEKPRVIPQPFGGFRWASVLRSASPLRPRERGPGQRAGAAMVVQRIGREASSRARRCFGGTPGKSELEICM